jgi:hypothetical protein
MTWQPPERVLHRPRVPAATLVAAFLAVALFLTGLRLGAPFFVAGAASATLGLIGALVGMRTVPLRLHGERVEDPRSQLPIDYREIRFLRISGRALVDEASTASARPLLIGHAQGVWRVPRSAGLDRFALYRWLLDRTALLRAPGALPGRLEEVRTRETAEFGSDQVLSSTGRAACPGEPPSVRWVACMTVAVALAGPLGRLLGAPLAYLQGMVWTAVVVGGLAALVAVGSAALRARLDKLRASSGIVVSPRSLTLEAGALRGELLWAEVRSLSVVNSRSPLASGLKLHLDGTKLLLGDHFACPLGEIERTVKRNHAHE